MGSFQSVIRGAKKREDISCCDIEHKHGKTLESRDDHLFLTSAFRFCLFMGDSCKNMKIDEKQSPVAVRSHKNCLFLLKQLKNWIANNFSGFNAAKIYSAIYEEPIYRSPGGGQQMVNTRYSIVLQIENRAFYQGANRSQKLPWDVHEPPPKSVTHGGSWYIVSMEVFKDETDKGGQSPDNREVHLKVILHIANRRMTWTPPDFSPFDIHCQTETYRYNEVLSPCVLNYHVDYTLSPEELCSLVRIQKYLLSNEQPNDPIPKDIRPLLPGLLEFNYGAINLDCQKLIISSNPNTVLHPYYKSDFNLSFQNPVPSVINSNLHWLNNEVTHEDHQDVNADGKFKKCPPYTIIKAEHTRTLVPGLPEFNHGAKHMDYRNLNVCRNPITVLHSSYYEPDLNLNFPNTVPSTVIPNLNWPNNEAMHEDHQDVNANGNSKIYPLSTNVKAGNSAAPGLKTCILLLLAWSTAAYPVSQGHQAEIEILLGSDNHFRRSFKIDKYALCYDQCKQNEEPYKNIFQAAGENVTRDFCEHQKKAMKANLYSLMRKHSLKSGTLQMILIWKLNKVFNVTDATIQYIFNDKKITDEEMTDLPMTITEFPKSDTNRTLFIKKMKDHVKELWKKFREVLLPSLKIDHQSENTNSSVNAKANNTYSGIITQAKNTNSSVNAKAIFVVGVIMAIAIFLIIKCCVFVVGVIMAIAIFLIIKCCGKKICKKLHESCLNYRRAARNEDEAEGDPNVMETKKREDRVTDSV